MGHVLLLSAWSVHATTEANRCVQHTQEVVLTSLSIGFMSNSPLLFGQGGGEEEEETSVSCVTRSVTALYQNNLSSYGDNKEDFSDLPPNQRKKRLQMKIEEILAKIQQETAARDGLMKMKGVYEANPSMGDPMTIEGQLNASSHNLEKLRLELHKYQGFLEEVEGGSPANRRHNAGTPQHNGIQRQHRNSGGSGGEEESLSRSASDSSVSANHNHKQSAPGTPLPAHGCSDSPESGLGTSHTSLPDSDDAPHTEYYDGELLPPLGTCRALYPFEATSEGSIPMNDGEELLIIEHDQGDGWTRVRRQNDLEEGFVPTSYIECTVISNC
ncbi:Formin-binding protein 1 [Homalodisca vitripennis]|nr:Formin-binding protein 1 [Homalodisca vitripennis]